MKYIKQNKSFRVRLEWFIKFMRFICPENQGTTKPGFSRPLCVGYNTHSFFKIITSACGLIAFSFIFLFQTSCDNKYYFQKNIAITHGQWAYNDTLSYQFSITDTLETYNLYLDFEYADTFSSQNVYIKLHTIFPDGKRLSKQKSFDLFDVQGQPQGQCSGRKCSAHTLLQEKAFFNHIGTYEIILEQYTRQDPLPGIFSIGLAIEPTGVKR